MKRQTPYRHYALLVLVLTVLSCLNAEDRPRALSPEREARTTELMAQLADSFASPVLIAQFQDQDGGTLALVGNSGAVDQRSTYFSPYYAVFIDSGGTLIDYVLCDSSSSVYRSLRDERFLAVSSAVPDSILVQITVLDSVEQELRAYETGVPYVADFLIHGGYLYFSTEKTLANIRRIDLQTGEQYSYDGFHQHNAGIVEEGGRLYAVTESDTQLITLNAVQPSNHDMPSGIRSTERLSMETTSSAFFNSWDELYEHLSVRVIND